MKIKMPLIALTLFANTAFAQETYPEITTPGFANKIDDMIYEACPAGVFDGNISNNVACADVTYAATSTILGHVSDYIKREAGNIGAFWAGAAQGELLGCARRLDNVSASKSALNLRDVEAVASYMNQSHEAAAACIGNIDNAENGIGRFVDTPAQNHVVDLLNCQVNPDQCTRRYNPTPL